MDSSLQKKASTAALRRKLFYYFAGALLTLMLLLSGTTGYILINRLTEVEDRNLLNSVESRSLALTEWRHHAIEIARQVTSRSRIREELKRYIDGKVTLEHLQKFTTPKLQDALQLSSEIAGIMRYSPQGELIATCGLTLPPDKWPEFIHDSIKTQQAVISNPVLIGDNVYVICACPIKSAKTKNLGTDIILYTATILTNLICKASDDAEKCDAFAGYMENGEIKPLLPKHYRHPFTETLNHHFSDFNSYLYKSIRGETGLANTNQDIIAYAAVADSDWGLAMSKSKKYLYAPVYTQLAYIIVISAAAYIVTLLGFWKFMTPLTGKMLLRMDELEDEISRQTKKLQDEIEQHEITEKEKEKVIAELKDALNNVHTLQGLLPICSYCKKIRDDSGYWNLLETYIHEHSLANFSHGICPDCMKKHFPEVSQINTDPPKNSSGNGSHNES